MKILGIETVTRFGTLAVVENGRILQEAPIDTGLNHTSCIIAVLDKLLASIKADMSEIDIIAVDIGPGSFTGIRVGIASAKGLAQADNKSLIGICSLESLCYKVYKEGILKAEIEYLVPFMDAKRGGVYTACCQVIDNKLQIIKEAYLSDLMKFSESLTPRTYVFGPDIHMLKKGDSPIFPSAGSIALLAEEKAIKGLKQNLIEPMYIYDVKYTKNNKI